ncbi:MAG TPA: hypothetical protein DCY57_02275 [Bacteroidetes bacterium]|jgi:hypothetical protein|nr:hypothetical protein [Bacteroidota bacterium]
MKPSKFNAEIKLAAKKTYYPQCLQYIEDNLDPDFHDLAKATLPYYLPSNILELPSKDERRAAIDSIPDNATPSHSKDLVKIGVEMLWKKDRANGIR